MKAKLVGKWKNTTSAGKLIPTDSKGVLTFTVEGKQYTTFLKDDKWVCSNKVSYTLNGNKYSNSLGSSFIINDIRDGKMYLSDVNTYRGHMDDLQMTLVTNDFSKAIIGYWEGVEMTGEETYGTKDHIWEFRADGTYVYHTKNAEGKIVADSSNTGNVYFVDGDYLGFRWVKDGIAYKELWDIDACSNDEMIWSAIREKADGTQFKTTLKTKRVKEIK